MAPSKQTQWVVRKQDHGPNELELEDAPIQEPRDYEVLVKIDAVSLNFRDLMILRGDYPFPLNLPVVSCSDGAGEVVAVGDKVTLWATGDRVMTLMNQAHLYGPATALTAASGLGGAQEGVLRQYGIFNEQGLVRAPSNLSLLEASTLVCAGVTAWNALYGLKTLKAGQSVLVLGTGGVSVFALQFAKAAGATVIATTSSEDKATALKKLGADHVVNYNQDLEWGQSVKKLSPGGYGVDQIIEVGGVETLHQSLKAIRPEGLISCIGSVSGPIDKTDNIPTILDCWLNNCTARGVSVGSRVQMEEMVATIEANDLHPLIDDKHFTFQETKAAFEYFSSKKNFGKVVISVV